MGPLGRLRKKNVPEKIDLGISIIPRFTAEEEIKAGRLAAIGLDWLPVCAVGIVQRRGGYLSPAAQMFLEMLQRHITNV